MDVRPDHRDMLTGFAALCLSATLWGLAVSLAFGALVLLIA